MDLDDPDSLPQGLVGLYERWFRRQFPSAPEFEVCLPFFEVLVAAEHSVPEIWLNRIFGWSKRDKAKVLDQVGSLVEHRSVLIGGKYPTRPQRSESIALFHKSLRDWLIDDRSSGAAFLVDTSLGAKRLINALWPAFVAWTQDPGNNPLDPFCDSELLSQLSGPNSEPGKLQQLAQLLSNPDVIRRRLLVGTDADETTRYQARHDFVDLVERSAAVWPKSVDVADPAAKCAMAIAQVAWESLTSVAQAASDKEPKESVLQLVSAVNMATGSESFKFVMAERLRYFIYKFHHSPGFEDYIFGDSNNDAVRNMSFLEDAVRNRFEANKDNPDFATWVKEWSEFYQEGYKPPWASN